MTRASKLALRLLLPGCLSILVFGCGGGSQDTTAASTSTRSQVESAETRTTVGAEAQATTDDVRAVAEKELPSSACEALPLSMAEAFDPHLVEQAGADEGEDPSSCVYSTPEGEALRLQLILELVPSLSEPSESAAKVICRKLADEIDHDSTYTESESLPELGQESRVAKSFAEAESNLDEDETAYVANWRESGSCVRLIFASVGSAPPEPLSKFIALAVSVSGSG